MEKINEIKLPEGVDRIAVKQYNDRIVIEFIPKGEEFKNGDFVYEDGRIMIVKRYPNMYHANSYPKHSNRVGYNEPYGVDFSSSTFRYATEDEKQLLIDALKKDGKRWNAEKLKIEDILKKGDLAIFWNNGDGDDATIRLYDKKEHEYHYDSYDIDWENAIKFESKEQFEKVLRGEI